MISPDAPTSAPPAPRNWAADTGPRSSAPDGAPPFGEIYRQARAGSELPDHAAEEVIASPPLNAQSDLPPIVHNPPATPKHDATPDVDAESASSASPHVPFISQKQPHATDGSTESDGHDAPEADKIATTPAKRAKPGGTMDTLVLAGAAVVAQGAPVLTDIRDAAGEKHGAGPTALIQRDTVTAAKTGRETARADLPDERSKPDSSSSEPAQPGTAISNSTLSGVSAPVLTAIGGSAGHGKPPGGKAGEGQAVPAITDQAQARIQRRTGNSGPAGVDGASAESDTVNASGAVDNSSGVIGGNGGDRAVLVEMPEAEAGAHRTGVTGTARIGGIERMLVLSDGSAAGSPDGTPVTGLAVTPHAAHGAPTTGASQPKPNEITAHFGASYTVAGEAAKPALSGSAPIATNGAAAIAGGSANGASSGSDDGGNSRREAPQGDSTDARVGRAAADALQSQLRTDQTPALEPAASLPGRETVDRAQLAEQLSRHIESMQSRSGHGEMTLNLNPEHLGALRLTVARDQNGVSARIVVETAQAHHAVDTARDQLKSALESRGMNLTSLDVTLSQGRGDNGFARERQDTQGSQQTRSWSPAPSGPAAAPQVATTVSRGYVRDTRERLDYQA